MNLYLDSEFDGHGGSLISLALAGDDGSRWYGVFAEYAAFDWVIENVIPHLYGMKPTVDGAPELLRFSLAEYLRGRGGCTIWADWPDDFAHLMRLMSGPFYSDSFMIPCTMQLIVTPDGEPKPEIPHNALSDAIALMKWHTEFRQPRAYTWS